MAPLLVQPTGPDTIIPTKGSPYSIGHDLYAHTTTVIAPGGQAKIPTGIHIQVPAGSYARVAPRSGLAVNHRIDIAAGVIDLDYRGEIVAVLVNNGKHHYKVTAGERIAQLILENALLEEIQVTDTLTHTQ